MTYLLDSNIFIEAKNHYYGFDFCPAYWDWLIQANKAKKVFSIERVADELAVGDDDLAKWTKSLGKEFFLKPDRTVFPALTHVSSWINQQSFSPAAINFFMDGADLYLVAHALAHNFTVVTREVLSDSLKKIKIPNVCNGVGVKYISPYSMLRHERARFVLDK